MSLARPLLIFLCAPALGSCSAFRANVPDDYGNSPVWAQPPKPWTEPLELRVVTWNVKDMVMLSSRRGERMARIGEALAERAPDVVCLQEGFVRGDIAAISEALAGVGLEHVQDYPSMAVGSGLWIYSRWPIVETWFHQYRENGHWWEFTQGDWWAGKGVAVARLELPDGRLLDIYNTHMVARYGSGSAAHDEDRMQQAEELIAFVDGASPPSIPTLLLGDLNCGPGDPPFRELEARLGLVRLGTGAWQIDHVLGLRDGAPYRTEAVSEATTFMSFLADADPPLPVSDHPGLLVDLRIAP